MSKPVKSQMRLNVFISQYAGVSRRQADALIRDRKVTINGQKAPSMGILVNPSEDSIKVKGKALRPVKESIYIAFHKPEKTLVTRSDPKGRTTVFHYFKKLKTRIFAVGRLDWNTEGLLLLTNDGTFSKKIITPKNQIPKTYMVKLDSIPAQGRLNKLLRGVTIPGGRVKALSVHRRPKAWVRIVIAEGRNRQLHFMFNKIGFSVKKIKRIQIGKLKLGSLKKGQARFLTPKDIHKIFAKNTIKKQSFF